MSEIDVSVVIPCYNTEKFLDQALASAEQNDRISLEIIVINDGSTDGSLEIMRAHEAADPRVRVIDRTNHGYGAEVNRGFDEARGTYVGILEPDDWVAPHMYDDLFEYGMSFSYTGAMPDIIKSPYTRVVLPETPNQYLCNCSYYKRVDPGFQPFRLSDAPHLIQHHPSIWSALYRKGFLEEKGIRFMEVPGAGWVDNPFLVETLCQTDAIAYLDTCYYCYREDTTEKALAFAERNPLLPLERWCDMAEVLERLGVADESVWRAQNLRGITYCCTAIEANGLDYPGLREKVVGIFSAMDPALVLDDPRIKPGEKRLFCELLGLPEPDVSDLAYMPELAKQAFYRLRMAGPRFTWLSVVDYLKRKRAREGR